MLLIVAGWLAGCQIAGRTKLAIDCRINYTSTVLCSTAAMPLSIIITLNYNNSLT